ncbi:MAG TPA: hypothetical protein GX743_01565 [Actinomycetales bacterium]|nr:hypothetical protein [Actinomycetales bacterium]
MREPDRGRGREGARGHGRGPADEPQREDGPGLAGEMGLYLATAAIFLAIGPLGYVVMALAGPVMGESAIVIPLVMLMVAALIYVVVPRSPFWRPRSAGDAFGLTILVMVWPIILLFAAGNTLPALLRANPAFFALLALMAVGVFLGLRAKARGWRGRRERAR